MISSHFIQRVRERIGEHVCPITLGDWLLHNLRNERQDVLKFVGRVNRRGLRIFRFRVEDGRHFYALIDTESTTLVTVMPPGFKPLVEGGGCIKLKDIEQ